MIHIGIDPGLQGAIAAIYNDEVVLLEMLPIVNKNVDAKALLDMIYEVQRAYSIIPGVPMRVIVEKVSTRPRQGSGATLLTGYNGGIIVGGLVTARIPHLIVTPQTWKGIILRGTKKQKEDAIAYAQARFPAVDLRRTRACKIDHDGKAEAICLACYGAQIK